MADIEQIGRVAFEARYNTLISWFNVKSIKSEQIALAYSRLKSYPESALQCAVDQFLEQRRPSAANFPTINEIAHNCCLWLDQHPETKFQRMSFDPIEDLRYPLWKLWDGFKILRDFGEERFMIFAAENRMPKQDVERVKMKYQYIQANIDQKKQVDNLVKKVADV